MSSQQTRVVFDGALFRPSMRRKECQDEPFLDRFKVLVVHREGEYVGIEIPRMELSICILKFAKHKALGRKREREDLGVCKMNGSEI